MRFPATGGTTVVYWDGNFVKTTFNSLYEIQIVHRNVDTEMALLGLSILFMRFGKK